MCDLLILRVWLGNLTVRILTSDQCRWHGVLKYPMRALLIYTTNIAVGPPRVEYMTIALSPLIKTEKLESRPVLAATSIPSPHSHQWLVLGQIGTPLYRSA